MLDILGFDAALSVDYRPAPALTGSFFGDGRAAAGRFVRCASATLVRARRLRQHMACIPITTWTKASRSLLAIQFMGSKSFYKMRTWRVGCGSSGNWWKREPGGGWYDYMPVVRLFNTFHSLLRLAPIFMNTPFGCATLPKRCVVPLGVGILVLSVWNCYRIHCVSDAWQLVYTVRSQGPVQCNAVQ